MPRAPTDLFLKLTPDWLLRAVEAGGLAPTGHLLALNCLENRVYDLRLEDGTHVVAKFYRPGRWSREAILDEHALLFELEAAEIPVAAPLRFESPSGSGTLHEIEGILYAVWPRVGGRAPDELTDDQLDLIGRLLARIHNVGAGGKAPHRRTLNADTYAREPLAFLESRGFLPPAIGRRYKAAVERLAKRYGELSRGVPLHRIHGDCHLGNLLHGREGWFFLDFDDLVIGPAVQDVWMLVPSRDAYGLHQRERFLAAYRQFRTFDDGWLRLIEPLRALRYVHYAAWIARRWNDPAFPNAFPHFGTDAYWESETRDIEEQLAITADSRGPSLGPVRGP